MTTCHRAGDDVKKAVDSLLKGEALMQPVRSSMGCGIKWHPAKQVALKKSIS